MAGARSAAERVQLESAIGWLGIAAIVFLLVAVGMLAHQAYRQMVADAWTRALNVTQVLAEHAARLFDATDLLVEHTAQAIAAMSWDEVEASRPLWQRLRSESDRFSYMEALWLNDAEGKLRLTSFRFPTPASNVADRDFFRAHLGKVDAPYISTAIIGRVTAKPSFLLSRRLKDGEGGFRGIASVTLDPGYFSAFYRTLDLPYAPNIMLYRTLDLAILVREPAAPDNFAPEPPDMMRQAIATAPLAGGFDDGRRLHAYRRLEIWPVYVSVSLDKSLIEAAWLGAILPYVGTGGAAGLALFGLSLFAFRQARAAKAARLRLEEHVRDRTACLEDALDRLRETLAQRDQLIEQKSILMREVNHRIKNSLQMVSSLLVLQSQSSQENHVRHQLSEAGHRVKAISDIHQLLYQGDDARTVPFHDYLRLLCRDLERSSFADGAGWDLRVKVESAELPADLAVPLGLVANELLMNGVKHAYPGDGPKPLMVELACQGGCVLRLTVADHGIGLPAGFDWRRSASLGMRLVHALTHQIGATLDVASTGHGTVFTITLPVTGASPSA